MKFLIGIFMLLFTGSCKISKATSTKGDVQTNTNSSDVDQLQFGCYYSSDTLENIVAYFPEEKIFYINNKQYDKENICEVIKTSIAMNKGVLHYLDPESNFFFMISIQREIEKCFKQRIEEMSMAKFGIKYEELNSEQKIEIDKVLSYRIVSE